MLTQVEMEEITIPTTTTIAIGIETIVIAAPSQCAIVGPADGVPMMGHIAMPEKVDTRKMQRWIIVWVEVKMDSLLDMHEKLGGPIM